MESLGCHAAALREMNSGSTYGVLRWSVIGWSWDLLARTLVSGELRLSEDHYLEFFVHELIIRLARTGKLTHLDALVAAGIA